MFNIEKCIKDALRVKSKSVEELAKEAGTTKQTLYNIFNKDDAKLSQLYSISKALGVSVTDTFEIEGENQLSKVPQHDRRETKMLEEKNALYEDYIQSLKRHIETLEREVNRLQGKDPGGPSSVKQIG